jgi:exodeoxyribonuclease-3
MHPMKITTWNVNGIRAREGDLTEWVLREKPDVLCLQEIKASLEQIPSALHGLDGYWRYWHGGQGGYSGVALLVSKALVPVHPRFSHPDFDHESRIVAVELGGLTLASLYVPNGGKDVAAKMRFLEALARYAAAHPRLILCGDLNVALTPRDVHEKLLDSKLIGQTPEERALLGQVIGHGLVDLLRSFDPDNNQLFTWWAPWRNHRERNIGWRLDYVLASEELARQAKSCRCERLFGTSDHGPVTAIFDGPLFDPSAVARGAPQLEPRREAVAPKPQLDLFA